MTVLLPAEREGKGYKLGFYWGNHKRKRTKERYSEWKKLNREREEEGCSEPIGLHCLLFVCAIKVERGVGFVLVVGS